MVIQLLAYGADPNFVDEDLGSPRQHAYYLGLQEIVEILVTNGAA